MPNLPRWNVNYCRPNALQVDRANMSRRDVTGHKFLTDIVTINLNVFCALMKDWIGSYLSITKQMQKRFEPNNLNSSLSWPLLLRFESLDRDTVGCFFVF